MDSREIFSKNKISNEQLTSAITSIYDVSSDEVLFIEVADDWLKKEDHKFIIEYNGQLSNEDDEHPKYHYCDIWYKDNSAHDKLKDLEKTLGENVIITID